MRVTWLNAVAAVALAAGMSAANAQSTQKQELERQPPGQAQQPAVGSGQTEKAAPRSPRVVGPQAPAPDQGKSSAQDTGQDGSDKAPRAVQSERPAVKPGETDSDPSAARQSQKQAPEKDRTASPSKDGDAKRGERAGAPPAAKDTGAAQREGGKSQRAGQPDRDRRDKDRSERSADDRTEGDRDPVKLSERQETTIRQTVARERNLNATTDVNFSVAVGTTVPRSVRLAPLPPSIVAIVPEYRGYHYVVVQDEIVIVHPRTYRIVAVVPVEGRAARASTATTSTRVRLSSEQRARILSYARSECTTVLAEPDFRLAVGAQIPQQIELCPFEDVVIEEVDVVRPYRFLVVRDQVVLVDPSSNTIVEVIR